MFQKVRFSRIEGLSFDDLHKKFLFVMNLLNEKTQHVLQVPVVSTNGNAEAKKHMFSPGDHTSSPVLDKNRITINV